MIVSWLLVRKEDRNGNFISFEYDHGVLREGFSITPKLIKYTGNKIDNTAPFAFIEFGYLNETEVLWDLGKDHKIS